jgi:uncharacterized membrane protein (DUF106 family)
VGPVSWYFLCSWVSQLARMLLNPVAQLDL